MYGARAIIGLTKKDITIFPSHSLSLSLTEGGSFERMIMISTMWYFSLSDRLKVFHLAKSKSWVWNSRFQVVGRYCS